jgi:hypothetical protein
MITFFLFWWYFSTFFVISSLQPDPGTYRHPSIERVPKMPGRRNSPEKGLFPTVVDPPARLNPETDKALDDKKTCQRKQKEESQRIIRLRRPSDQETIDEIV